MEINSALMTMEAKVMRVVHYTASAFSLLLSPLLMPTYGMFIAFWLSTLQILLTTDKLTVIAVVALMTCVVPVILISLMRYFGLIADVHLNARRERFLPYAVIVVCYVVSALYLFNINAPTWMWMFMFGAGIAALISMVVTFFWKISAHMAGIGGLIGLLCKINSNGDGVFDLMPIICVTIVVAGILGSSRIAMERHTFWQVVAGVLNGFFCVYLI